MKVRTVVAGLLVILIIGGCFVNNAPRIAADSSVIVAPPEIKDSPAMEAIPDKPAIKFTLDGIIGEEVPVRNIGCNLVTAPPKPGDSAVLICVVEESYPIFPGGEEAMNRFLQEHIRYPELASDSSIQGTVFVSFAINTDGSITDIKTIGQHRGAGLEEEAIRVVGLMPKWKPVEQNGKKVKTQFYLPIRFTLAE